MYIELFQHKQITNTGKLKYENLPEKLFLSKKKMI